MKVFFQILIVSVVSYILLMELFSDGKKYDDIKLQQDINTDENNDADNDADAGIDTDVIINGNRECCVDVVFIN